MATQKGYALWRILFSLIAALAIIFYPYLFGKNTYLPTDMLNTMTSPYNQHYNPPQAQNHYLIDGLFQGYPYKVVTQANLSQGNLSYWNSHILGGYPQYAESLANNFDPFNILLLVFDPLTTIHLQTLLQMLVAGIGMALLLRYLGISETINLLFSLAFMLNTMFIASAIHRCLLAEFCWIPFVILMVIKYFDTLRKEYILYSSVFLAVAFLGGNLQTSAFALFIVLLLILLYPARSSLTVFQRGGIALVTIVFALGLSAIMWFPTLELFFNTIASGSLNSTSIYKSYTLVHRLLSLPLLIYFFSPELLGSPQILSLKNIAGVDMIDFNGALGLVPMLFATWALIHLRKDPKAIPFIIIAILGIGLPILTPLYSFLYHRFFIVSALAFSVLGAMGMNIYILKRKESRFMFKTSLSVYLLVLSGVISSAVVLSFKQNQIKQQLTDYLAPKIQATAFGSGNESWMIGRIGKTLEFYGLGSPHLILPLIAIGLFLVALYLFRKNRLHPTSFTLIGIALTALQLILFARMWFPVNSLDKFPLYPPNAITAFLQQQGAGSRYIVYRDPQKEPVILAANMSNVFGTNYLGGYESLTPKTSSTFLKDQSLLDTLHPGLLGLMNVRFVVAGRKVPDTGYFKPVFFADSLTVYENSYWKERAFVVFGSEVFAAEEQVTQRMRDPQFNGSTALLSAEEDVVPKAFPPDSASIVTFAKVEENYLSMNVTVHAGGFLILTDTYYPGWKCLVNGEEQKIYRAYNVMRAVEIKPGTSHVEFIFEPQVFLYGKWISIASVLLIAATIFLIRKKSLE